MNPGLPKKPCKNESLSWPHNSSRTWMCGPYSVLTRIWLALLGLRVSCGPLLSHSGLWPRLEFCILPRLPGFLGFGLCCIGWSSLQGFNTGRSSKKPKWTSFWLVPFLGTMAKAMGSLREAGEASKQKSDLKSIFRFSFWKQIFKFFTQISLRNQNVEGQWRLTYLFQDSLDQGPANYILPAKSSPHLVLYSPWTKTALVHDWGYPQGLL